jgi:hypothetical protein
MAAPVTLQQACKSGIYLPSILCGSAFRTTRTLSFSYTVQCQIDCAVDVFFDYLNTLFQLQIYLYGNGLHVEKYLEGGGRGLSGDTVREKL